MKNTIAIGTWLLAASLLALLVEPAPGQTQLALGAIDTSGYPLIRGMFRLTDGGSLIRTIDTSRIMLTEDGVRRPVAIECRDRRNVSVAVSVGLERSLDNAFSTAQAAAQSMLRRFRYTDLDDASSLWAFATFIDHPVGMGRDSTAMERELADVSVASFPFNGTPLYETLHRAVEEAASRADVTNRAVVFFTDGVNNTSYFNRSLDDVQRRAVGAGVRIFAVTIGDKPEGVSAMRQLCDATGGFHVPVSNPRAVDSVADALHLEPLASYWCSYSFSSAFCPNGLQRTVSLAALSAAGDTIDAETIYQSPLRDSELTPVPLWISPRNISSRPGDTIWLALGYTDPAGSSIASCGLLLRHDGMMRIDGERLFEPFRSWSIDLAGNAATFIQLDPGTAPVPAGEHVVLRMPFIVTTTDAVSCDIAPWREAHDCFTLAAVDAVRSAALHGDTVFGERMKVVGLPVSFHAIRLPEGIQQVSLTCRLPALTARFNLEEPFSLDARWTDAVIDEMRVGFEFADQILSVTCSGPPADGVDTLGTIRVSILPGAAYEIPVRFETSEINAFAATATSTRQGLVVLRDSCRNNLVAIHGLFLSPPSPHPLSAVCRFEALSDRDMTVDVALLDLRGTIVAHREPVHIRPGITRVEIPVTHLVPGTYLLRASAEGDTIFKTVIVNR